MYPLASLGLLPCTWKSPRAWEGVARSSRLLQLSNDSIYKKTNFRFRTFSAPLDMQHHMFAPVNGHPGWKKWRWRAYNGGKPGACSIQSYKVHTPLGGQASNSNETRLWPAIMSSRKSRTCDNPLQEQWGWVSVAVPKLHQCFLPPLSPCSCEAFADTRGCLQLLCHSLWPPPRNKHVLWKLYGGNAKTFARVQGYHCVWAPWHLVCFWI